MVLLILFIHAWQVYRWTQLSISDSKWRRKCMAPSLKKKKRQTNTHDSQASTQMRSNSCLCRDEVTQSKIKLFHCSFWPSTVNCPTGSLKVQSVETVLVTEKSLVFWIPELIRGRKNKMLVIVSLSKALIQRHIQEQLGLRVLAKLLKLNEAFKHYCMIMFHDISPYLPTGLFYCCEH